MAIRQPSRVGSHAWRTRGFGIGVAVLGTLAAGPYLFAQASRSQAPLVARGTSGPVAISASRPGHLAVLQADGALFDLEVATLRTNLLYRVPSRYQVVEVAAGEIQRRPILAVVIYERQASGFQNYVLQVGSTREPIWSWLPLRGLYVGLALEEAGQIAYVGNASSNEVYELPLGSKQGSPRYLMSVPGATSLGPFAYDRASHAILAIDMGGHQVYRLDLQARTGDRIARLADAGDLRAIAWAVPERRVFLADSERQTVWAIDLVGASPPVRRFITDPALREPAGLALLDGSLWVADEGARMLFEVALKTGRVGRKVSWPPRPAT